MKTLYSRIEPILLEQLVNAFYEKVYQSNTIKHLFNNNIEEVKMKQLLFLTQFLGGPTVYNQKFGHPRLRMKHLPHKITEEAKKEWLKCMNEAIDEIFFDQSLKNDLKMAFPKVAQHMVNS